MKIIGLTGSIGMGKSTTADLFKAFGVPVHDADRTVHALYAGEAVSLIEARFPNSTNDGRVNREALAKMVLNNEAEMRALETIIHPLVRQKEYEFLDNARKSGAPLVLLDIPLLFETKGDQRCDVILVVTATAEIQRARVLARENMSVEKFEAILKRQVPDQEKRQRAHALIATDFGIESASYQVKSFLRALQNA